MPESIGWVIVERRGEDAIVRIHGDIDISNAVELEKALDHSLDGGRIRHVVDLTDATYFDSSGIRILFSLATRLQSRRQELHIVVPEAGLTRRVLELTGLPQVVPMHASMAELPSRSDTSPSVPEAGI
jgi:anti-anti-sigma factor